MKTIKELAELYLKDRDITVLQKIMNDFLLEIDHRGRQREVRTMLTLVPVIDEISREWVKFTTIVNEKIEDEEEHLSPGGFLKSLKRGRNNLYTAYIDMKVKMEIYTYKRDKKNGLITESKVEEKDDDETEQS